MSKVITLTGGPPWGFRMQGGVEASEPLRISKVNPSSRAYWEGVEQGDYILSINGVPAQRLLHSQAVNIINHAASVLNLELMSASRTMVTFSHAKENLVDCRGQQPVFSPGRNLCLTQSQSAYSKKLNRIAFTPIKQDLSTTAKEKRPDGAGAKTGNSCYIISAMTSRAETSDMMADTHFVEKGVTKAAAAVEIQGRRQLEDSSLQISESPPQSFEKRPSLRVVTPELYISTTSSDSEAEVISPGLNLPKPQAPMITLLQKSRAGELPRASRLSESTVGTVRTSPDEWDAQQVRSRSVDMADDRDNSQGNAQRDADVQLQEKEAKKRWYAEMYRDMHKLDKLDYHDYKPAYKLLEGGSFQLESYQDKVVSNKDCLLEHPKLVSEDEQKMVPGSQQVAIEDMYALQKDQPNSGSAQEQLQRRPRNQSGGMDSLISEIIKPERTEAASSSRSPSVDYQNEESHQLEVFTESPSIGFDFCFSSLDVASPRSPKHQYLDIQKGGEIPLSGLRKPAPITPPPRDIPKKVPPLPVAGYNRSPAALSREQRDEYDAKRKEVLKKVEEEERRRKQQEELAKQRSRRHSDNFALKDKSPIPTNRYDEYPCSPAVSPRGPLSPRIASAAAPLSPGSSCSGACLKARARYTLKAEHPKELGFVRGELIDITRQVDENWYEGRLNGRVGIVPRNYVEVLEELSPPGRPSLPRLPEGTAVVKFDFLAQTSIELPLCKGETVALIRRVDENWLEGRAHGRLGIFPVSYVTITKHPGTWDPSYNPCNALAERSPSIKPEPSHTQNMSPTARLNSHMVYSHQNGGSSTGTSQHQRSYSEGGSVDRTANGRTYDSSDKNNNLNNNNSNIISGLRNSKDEKRLAGYDYVNTEQAADPNIPVVRPYHGLELPSYRVLFNYAPQREDELELLESDIVHVIEKCDDGWFVGTSGRTGMFGTFPGNYVAPV